ncbi:MAG TPA: hypothetical protein VNP98_16705 [Chthoniobacterales bacterium]|nr:hypothetical protein [Chthoniobacterales bacterium]
MPTPINPPPIYQNPFMAPNGFSGIHLNAYMTDTGAVEGPASAPNQSVQQKVIPAPGIAATIAFNAKGQIVTIHIGSPDTPEGAPTIMLIDPTTLNTLDSVRLPQRKKNTSGKISFAGGYFYLDQNSNVVCVTANQKLQIYSTDNDQLALGQTYDLQSFIHNSSDILNSVLPDSLGNIWYITQQGTIGYVDTTGKPSVEEHLNEPISKSFASDGNGRVYVVTDSPNPGVVNGALYCYRASANKPTRVWRTSYTCGNPPAKSGQNQVGSGTTPTCFDDFKNNQFVAIADNSPQMNVNVYRRDNGKLVVQQPVFEAWPDANSCENSLIAMNRSIIVENNFGNTDIKSTAGTKTTTPGVNRVDFDPDTKSSKVVWHNDTIAVPSVVSQLSTGDGMIYTYAKDSTGWFWAALDFETGDLVQCSDYVKFTDAGAPEEEASNNYYAGLTVGPDGAAYLSVFGGLTVWRKAS